MQIIDEAMRGQVYCCLWCFRVCKITSNKCRNLKSDGWGWQPCVGNRVLATMYWTRISKLLDSNGHSWVLDVSIQSLGDGISVSKGRWCDDIKPPIAATNQERIRWKSAILSLMWINYDQLWPILINWAHINIAGTWLVNWWNTMMDWTVSMLVKLPALKAFWRRTRVLVAGDFWHSAMVVVPIPMGMTYPLVI